jgi:hypothetical protein
MAVQASYLNQPFPQHDFLCADDALHVAYLSGYVVPSHGPSVNFVMARRTAIGTVYIVALSTHAATVQMSEDNGFRVAIANARDSDGAIPASG